MHSLVANVLSLIVAVALVGAAAHVGQDKRVRSTPVPQLQIDAGNTVGRGQLGFGVAIRLVDLMKNATVQSAEPASRSRAMLAHWRKMRLPANPSEHTTHIALRTSEKETQWTTPASKGQSWSPDARVWNMNEGSFDQRESIALVAPGKISLHVDVPEGGLLAFSPGVLGAKDKRLSLRVLVNEHKLFEQEFLSHDLAGWGNEMRVDLSRYAGTRVDLTLEADGAPGVGLVALFGNPVIYSRKALMPNVLWIVIDALRPDVIPSFHDDAEDARKLSAEVPPLEALLPKTPGLMPHLDKLSAQGVKFTHAYSAGSWTRPGTLSMLSGARSSELGIPALPWVLPPETSARFYAGDQPLLPLLLRKHGYTTRAFVNNYFMVGYAPVGIDMGFERVDDHRYRTRDTMAITKSASDFMRSHRDTQFFVFCNYNSPHEPFEPPKDFQARVGNEPKDPTSRLYMAEAAKDDEGVGQLIRILEEEKLLERTIIVVTADHGETLSSAHDGVGLDRMRIRYHHAVSNYEETTRIPILLVMPKQLPQDLVVKARVRNTDIAPTVLELLGQHAHPKMTGKSLLPLVKGQTETNERLVISEGRGTRAIIAGKYRLLLNEYSRPKAKEDAEESAAKQKPLSPAELYDLETDPGERHNLAGKLPHVVSELEARLTAADARVETPGTKSEATSKEPAKIHLRFSTKNQPHRIVGKIFVDPGSTLRVSPVGLPPEAIKAIPTGVEIAFVMPKNASPGFDVTVIPDSAPVHWKVFVDDAEVGPSQIFGGPFGVRAPSLREGITSYEARHITASTALPYIDVGRDFGLFVVRDPSGSAFASTNEVTLEGAQEMNRLLREWGYAKANSKH